MWLLLSRACSSSDTPRDPFWIGNSLSPSPFAAPPPGEKSSGLFLGDRLSQAPTLRRRASFHQQSRVDRVLEPVDPGGTDFSKQLARERRSRQPRQRDPLSGLPPPNQPRTAFPPLPPLPPLPQLGLSAMSTLPPLTGPRMTSSYSSLSPSALASTSASFTSHRRPPSPLSASPTSPQSTLLSSCNIPLARSHADFRGPFSRAPLDPDFSDMRSLPRHLTASRSLRRTGSTINFPREPMVDPFAGSEGFENIPRPALRRDPSFSAANRSRLRSIRERSAEINFSLE